MADVPISKIQVPGSEDTLFLRDSTAANKVQSATNGNLAGLDANGNLVDSGVGASSIGNLSGSHLGICETAASTSAKIVTIGDGTWIPKEGDIIGVKFTYSNTALFVTLNVNGIGNKNIWYGDSVDPSGADYICGKADSYIFYMYDGTYWIWLNEGQHDGNNFPSVAVYTASNQQVKIGTCNYYTLTNKSYCHFIFRYPNTCKDMLFMKINNSSSKTIYINGEISSSTNYTLPAGTYIAYYENDKWYFRTDGILPAKTTEGAEINERLDTTTTSSSGNPISITGLKSNQLSVNPVITFEPIQAGSGDPSPSNVRAISGYDKIEVLSCGVNLFDKDAITTGYALSTTTGLPETGSNFCISDYIRVRANTSYYIGYTSTGRHWFYDAGKNPIEMIGNSSAYAYTPTQDGYIRLSIYNYSGKLATLQVEEGSSESTYQAYHKTTDLSEPLPQTVYGGSLDVRAGVLTVTHGICLDLGSISWTKYGSGDSAYFESPTNTISGKASGTGWCECYKVSQAANITSAPNHSILIGTNGRLFIKHTEITSATDLQTQLNGMKMVYELATPITIQLTPHEISLLKDYAYVSTNGTNIALDYHNGEIATLGDVSQLGETVNLIGERVEFEDVSQYFVKDDTSINSANISAYRIGKMVFISGSFVPNTLSSLQNKLLFNITNDKILPLSANIPVSGIYVPVITQSSTAWSIILTINKLYKRIKTDNNGAYGQITNITTNSLITFSASYVCQG